METTWIPTNRIYHDVMNEPDEERRADRYEAALVTPWAQMMSMMTGPNGAAAKDRFAGARKWRWLLPDQTVEMAALLAQLEPGRAWERGAVALEKAFNRFGRWQERIPFDTVTGWLVLGDPAHGDPLQDGYTGATDWFQPRILA